MRNLKDIIFEKLRVSNKKVLDDGLSVDVPYYEFVIWYTGFFNKKPDELTESDFRSSYFADCIVDSKGIEVFANARLAYDFYKSHKDENVTVTIDKQKSSPDGYGPFLHIIDFGNIVFYANAQDDFVNYVQYHQEI